GLKSSILSGLAQSREFARALAARAMLRVAEARHADAWQDLLTCHRLGRRLANGGLFIEALVRNTSDSMAIIADLAFLEGAKLNSEQIKACLKDLQSLPPMPGLADKVDLGERLVFLDTVLRLDRYGIGYLKRLGSGKGPLGELSPRAKAMVEP